MRNSHQEKDGRVGPDNYSQGICHLVCFVEKMVKLASHFETIQGQKSILQFIDMIFIAIDHELSDLRDRVEFFIISVLNFLMKARVRKVRKGIEV
jgi:hypothetical protein